MEVIRINRERIKIMLSPLDMSEMEINCEMLDDFDKRGREAFGKIMKEARNKCGFISCGRKIFVQIFPSKDGGCELFITKLSDAELSSTIKESKHYYRFEDMNSLIGFCSAARSYNVSGIAYRDKDRGIYYIELDEDFDLCGEFGGKRCAVGTEAYIAERCTFVCDNAVKRLGELG